jgi:hypothetical protein
MKKVKHIGAKSPSGGSNRKAAYVVIFVIAIVVTGIVIFTNSSETGRTASAQSDKSQKKYRATRRVIKDDNTGEVRVPSEAEVATMVADLAELTRQPEAGAETLVQNGGVVVEIGEGFGGTMLFRVNPDGTSEMKCVFSLAEGLEFFGFVEDVQ